MLYHDTNVGKGDRPRTNTHTRAYQDNFELAFGKKRKKAKRGVYVWDVAKQRLVHVDDLADAGIAARRANDNGWQPCTPGDCNPEQAREFNQQFAAKSGNGTLFKWRPDGKLLINGRKGSLAHASARGYINRDEVRSR